MWRSTPWSSLSPTATDLVDLQTVELTTQRQLHHDKAGDSHFDLISALIKSVRGSDPDAAVYWLARLLEAGEDPLFVARRIVILAAEDVGLADPQALAVAVAAQQATHFIGLPEAKLPLAEATIYLALAPKSNSAMSAYANAAKAIQERGQLPVPLHLRNAVTGLMAAHGYGKNYQYAHDYARRPAARPSASARRAGRQPLLQGHSARSRGPAQ